MLWCDDYRDQNHDFLGKSNGIDIAIFCSKCNSIPILYCLRETGNWRRRSQNGFYTPASPITPNVEKFIFPRIRSRRVQRSLYLQLRILGRNNPSRNHAHEGQAIGAGGHRIGFTPPRWRSLYLCESDHAECRGVHIFNSEYWGKQLKLKGNRILYTKSNRNRIKGKNHNCHITKYVCCVQCIFIM